MNRTLIAFGVLALVATVVVAQGPGGGGQGGGGGGQGPPRDRNPPPSGAPPRPPGDPSAAPDGSRPLPPRPNATLPTQGRRDVEGQVPGMPPGSSLGAQFSQQSGEMRLNFQPPKDGAQKSIKLRVIGLAEVAANGTILQNIADLADRNFPWSAPRDVMVGGASASFVNADVNLPIPGQQQQCRFNMSSYMMGGDGSTMQGDVNVPFKKGNMKWEVTMSNWPWMSNSSVLALRMMVITPNEKGGAMSKPRQDMPRLTLDDGGFIDMPGKALVDGQSKPINASVYDEVYYQQLVFTFPKGDKLFYDPIVSLNEVAQSSPASSVFNVASMVFSSVVAVFFLFFMH